MRVRPQAGLTQQLWLVLGLESGLEDLQSRRLMALLVSVCAPTRLPNYRTCRHHSMRFLPFAHPRPQRARDRDPATAIPRIGERKSNQGSSLLLGTAREQIKVGHILELLRFRLRVGVTEGTTVSNSIWYPPSSSQSSFGTSSVSEELNKGKV